MNLATIEQLKALEAKATPAPWPNLGYIHLNPNLDTVIANREIQLIARHATPAEIAEFIVKEQVEK